uniref:(California timema) hypothetical protein n=1 Tax=Timema californicum TaxID=61474 RepID=A0A7R9P2S6_TIMCA|nr:unnamed protein product [Timema californicum]
MDEIPPKQSSRRKVGLDATLLLDFQPGVWYHLTLSVSSKNYRMKVSKDDSLPKYVCHRCLHKLEMCFEFQESCVKSEAVLRHRINIEQNSAKSNKPRKARAVSIENEDEVQIIDAAEFVATDLDMHVEKCDNSFGADDDYAEVDGLEDVAKQKDTLLVDDTGGEAKSINTLSREADETRPEPTNLAQSGQTEKRLNKGAFALQRQKSSTIKGYVTKDPKTKWEHDDQNRSHSKEDPLAKEKGRIQIQKADWGRVNKVKVKQINLLVPEEQQAPREDGRMVKMRQQTCKFQMTPSGKKLVDPLIKERERIRKQKAYRKRVSEGKVKFINQLSPEEQQAQREHWRVEKMRQRNRRYRLTSEGKMLVDPLKERILRQKAYRKRVKEGKVTFIHNLTPEQREHWRMEIIRQYGCKSQITSKVQSQVDSLIKDREKLIKQETYKKLLREGKIQIFDQLTLEEQEILLGKTNMNKTLQQSQQIQKTTEENQNTTKQFEEYWNKMGVEDKNLDPIKLIANIRNDSYEDKVVEDSEVEQRTAINTKRYAETIRDPLSRERLIRQQNQEAYEKRLVEAKAKLIEQLIPEEQQVYQEHWRIQKALKAYRIRTPEEKEKMLERRREKDRKKYAQQMQDAQKRERIRQVRRERYKKKLMAGKVKRIAQMTADEKEERRNQWRTQKANQYLRKKAQRMFIDEMLIEVRNTNAESFSQLMQDPINKESELRRRQDIYKRKLLEAESELNGQTIDETIISGNTEHLGIYEATVEETVAMDNLEDLHNYERTVNNTITMNTMEDVELYSEEIEDSISIVVLQYKRTPNLLGMLANMFMLGEPVRANKSCLVVLDHLLETINDQPNMLAELGGSAHALSSQMNV